MPDPVEHVIDVSVNLDELSWGDLEEIEEIAGKPIGTELGTGNVSVRTMRALIVWKRRKTDPSFTLDDLGKITASAVGVDVKGGGKQSPNRAQRRAAR